jgi:Sulfotransferase family
MMETGTSPSTAWRGPLFVIGMWRSGTSLLYALLNKHPQIALMYEGDLLLLRPLFWIPGAQSRWLRRWEFWNQAPERHGLDMHRLAGHASGLQKAAEDAYREYAEQAGAVIGGDKSPNYFDCLARLSRDFPDARFIVIWRDPASICRSVIRAAQEDHSWFNRRGMTLRVLMGMKAMRAECDRLIKRGARLHELQYQNLVQNPVETMEGICQFLEIPFVPEMASLSGANRTAIYEGGHHSLVKGDRIVASVERAEVLPQDLQQKIARYLALWREQSAGQWPPASLAPSGASEKPSLGERILDRFRYRSLRTFDAAVILLYCFAPLWLLQRFRAFKHEREEASAQVKQAAVPSPNSVENNRVSASHSK